MTRILLRLLNALGPNNPPIVFVSTNNSGMGFAKTFNVSDLVARPNLSKLSTILEPHPRHHQGPAFLQVLASALGSLDAFLPADAEDVRVLMLTPWHAATQGHAHDNEDWGDILNEIASYIKATNTGKVERQADGGTGAILSCELVLVDMQHGDPAVPLVPLLNSSCTERIKEHILSKGQTVQSWSADSMQCSDLAFESLFRRIVGWGFPPRPVTLTIQAGTLQLHCDLRPAVWTNLPWWNPSLKSLVGAAANITTPPPTSAAAIDSDEEEAEGPTQSCCVVPLDAIDALRLSSAAFTLAPATCSAASGRRGGSTLPTKALSENRSLFVAVCTHLARHDLGLLFRPEVSDGSNSTSIPVGSGHGGSTEEGIWLMHCESSHESGDGSSPAGISATLQQLLPAEVVLGPLFGSEHCPLLNASETSRAGELATPVEEMFSAGLSAPAAASLSSDDARIPPPIYNLLEAFSTSPCLFDRPPPPAPHAALGGLGHVRNLGSFSSPWLQQYVRPNPNQTPKQQQQQQQQQQQFFQESTPRHPAASTSTSAQFPPLSSLNPTASLGRTPPKLQKRHHDDPKIGPYPVRPQLASDQKPPPQQRQQQQQQHQTPKFQKASQFDPFDHSTHSVPPSSSSLPPRQEKFSMSTPQARANGWGSSTGPNANSRAGGGNEKSKKPSARLPLQFGHQFAKKR